MEVHDLLSFRLKLLDLFLLCFFLLDLTPKEVHEVGEVMATAFEKPEGLLPVLLDDLCMLFLRYLVDEFHQLSVHVLLGVQGLSPHHDVRVQGKVRLHDLLFNRLYFVLDHLLGVQ